MIIMMMIFYFSNLLIGSFLAIYYVLVIRNTYKKPSQNYNSKKLFLSSYLSQYLSYFRGAAGSQRIKTSAMLSCLPAILLFVI